MLKRLLTLAFACILFFQTIAQNPPKRELRGVWITTYLSLDWPNKSQSATLQKAALISILDHHKETGMNVAYFQVRSQCDAMYPSSIEPWSSDITGVQGKNPGYDPMQFAIEECHKRGIEFHAWINPYRAVGNEVNLTNFDPNHIAKKQPEWMMKTVVAVVNGVPVKTLTMNPGIPGVRDHIDSVISDIVTRYDIDGIHFDDYFYPNPGMTNAHDDAAFIADPRGFTSRADWRRDNINLMIRRISETVDSIKPWVEFGVSPTGIYRNSTNPAIGSPTAGLEHYTTLYGDSRKWIQEKWVDYLAPQVYWYIGQTNADYSKIIPWWNNNAFERHIYIGMAAYKVVPVNRLEPAWTNPSTIPNEVRLNRKPEYNNIYGEIFFRTLHMRQNKLGFRDSLRLFFYNKPALQPSMPWRDAKPPKPATSLKAVKYAEDSVVLRWNKPDTTSDEFDKAKQFVVYRSENATIDQTDANNILAITNQDENVYTDKKITAGTTYHYVVTALDRFHNESVSSNQTDNVPPTIICPGARELFVNNTCEATIPDYTTLVTVQDDIVPADAITITQTPVAGTVISGPGSFTVNVTSKDAGGNIATCSFLVTVRDSIKPMITDVSANPSSLWPPNHKMRNVKVNYNSTDNCGPVTNVLTVRSNEPINGIGDGNTEVDWEVINNHLVKLRAERSGTLEGRIYTIKITSTDASGNVSTETVDVTVPHDHGEIITQKSVLNDKKVSLKDLSVRVVANPSKTQFTLITAAARSTTLQVRVTDNVNRVIERRNGLPSNGTIQLGSNYKPGIYNVEVIQGTKRVTLKVVKGR